MLSEHSKECSLAQLAMSNEFMHPFLSHRRITRLSKKFAVTSDFKILASISGSCHYPCSLPHFSLCAYLQNANLWLACLSISRMCILCELTAMNVLACAGLSATLLSHIIFKRLSTKKDCVILLWRQKVAWALFCIKMADIYN